MAKKIIDQGFKSFYSDANAAVKMDVAPLIEQLPEESARRAMKTNDGMTKEIRNDE